MFETLKELKVELKIKRLNIGDYLLSKRVVVEVKRINDFVNSIVDNRLLEQMRHLVENYEKPLLILEGDSSLYEQRDVHQNAILGALAMITINYGIPVISTADYDETARLLAVIAKREQENKKTEFSLHSRKPLTLKEQQQYLVEALPGIGPGIAKKLLKHFKSVKAVFNASQEELQEVEKVGRKKAETIRKILDDKF